jgi:transcriptional regulator with XRE-family HTH domain
MNTATDTNPTASANPRSIKPLDALIGANIRDTRMSAKMSQTTLAGLTGVTFQQVQKYEKGKNRVAASTLVRIAEALGVTISYLVE